MTDAGKAGRKAIVRMSHRSNVDGRIRGERPRSRLTTHQTSPIQPIVTAMPARFMAGGQSGRVPHQMTVPVISHREISGAARLSIADSEL